MFFFKITNHQLLVNEFFATSLSAVEQMGNGGSRKWVVNGIRLIKVAAIDGWDARTPTIGDSIDTWLRPLFKTPAPNDDVCYLLKYLSLVLIALEGNGKY